MSNAANSGEKAAIAIPSPCAEFACLCSETE
jgi:hypothetical protein